MTFKYVVEATMERFMERPLLEKLEYYIEAEDAAEAHECLYGMLRSGGWQANKVTGKEIFVIRADHSERR